MPTRKPKPNIVRSRRVDSKFSETDSTYFLKLVVFVLLGTLWLKFKDPIMLQQFTFTGIPIGFVIGLILVRHFETRQSDRKIWYAVLVVVTIICYFVPAGIVI